MAGDWPRSWLLKPLDECMTTIIDYRGKSPRKASLGIPLITAKVVKGGRILTPDEFVPPEDYEAWARRGIPASGDVVLTTEAPLGEVAQLGDETVALAQRIIALRGIPGLLNNRYLKFLIQSEFVQDQLRARATGTTVLGIKQAELRKVILPLPPLVEQEAIGSLLGVLDDKIELNRQMNRTLEAMAQGLFKSWFVDFDPVAAKAAGLQPLGMDGETATLFPAGFTDSSVGLIPNGWQVSTIGFIGENRREIVQPDAISPGTWYIGLEHMPRGSIVLDEGVGAAGLKSAKTSFRRGDVLFGKLRPYLHKVGSALSSGVCSTDILVVTPADEAWRSLLLGHLSSKDFVDYADGASGGTRMPRVSWEDMARYTVVLPGRALGHALNEMTRVTFDQIAANVQQSRVLAELRDMLLPKLLSGEIRVREAERLVGRAGA